MRWPGFFQNEEAVIGLPLRLVVSLIIGMIALGTILAFLSTPGLVPQPLVVSVSPLVGTIAGNETENVSFLVSVSDREGHAQASATVIITGLGSAGIGRTNASGRARVCLSVSLEPGVLEGYLDVRVSAAQHPRFEQAAMVKILREP